MVTPDAEQLDRERSLVTALQRGDETAFEALVRHYGAPLLHTARRLLSNDADAADAVQDAFLSAFRGIGTFGGGSSLTTWLHRIVINASLMKLRTRRRKPEESIEDLLPRYQEDGHHVHPPTTWRQLPTDEAERREERRIVRGAIERLPESYRTVLLLRDIEQYDTEQTARFLDLTTGAVKIRLHRARQALRSLLDPHLREAEAC